MAETPTAAPRRVWRAGGGMRTALAFAALILLPFYVSVGPMLAQRLRAGLWTDTIALGVLGAAFTVLMGLLALRLVHAVRARIEVGEHGVRYVLPNAASTIPLWHFNTGDIPYDRIQSVETRREIFGGRLAPTFVRATRLITRDGQKIVLGYVNEGNQDQTFPFPEIGAEIAKRAGINVADRGTVRRSLKKRALGLTSAAPDNTSVPEAEIATIRALHRRSMIALIAGLLALVVGGIALDATIGPRSSYADIGGAAPAAKGR